MRDDWRWALALWALLLPAVVFGAKGAGAHGTVTGTVTLNGRETSDVVVSIKGSAGEVPSFQLAGGKSKTAMVDQRGIKFLPRVSAVLVGTLVNFPNNDKSWHNVYSASSSKPFDLGLYPPGESRGVTFDKTGVVRILCNVHPDMEAYVVVKEHPYFAVPNERGVYRIPSLPLGEYRLEIWHPEVGTKEKVFKIVREGEVPTIDVKLKKMR